MLNQIFDCDLSFGQQELVATMILFPEKAQQIISSLPSDVRQSVELLFSLPESLARELAYEVLLRAKYAGNSI